jgi:hypothetical protein
MLRKLTIVVAAIVAIGVAAGPHGTASGASYGEHAGGLSRGLGHHRGVGGQSGAAGRFGGSTARASAGYAGSRSRYDTLGHESSGWRQPGWGGTRSPGFGYGFEPQLGGLSH